MRSSARLSERWFNVALWAVAAVFATFFCPHCGIGIFERCPACSHRKSAFERFCYACGDRTTGITDGPESRLVARPAG